MFVTGQEFFAQAPEPPPARAVAGAIATLRSIGALDSSNNVTSLGRSLSRVSAVCVVLVVY